jgi:Leucine-rich repeat (LRR) protein
MGQLIELYIYGGDIEYLPGNLFEQTPNLEIVSFSSCKIKFIDSNILDCLHKLKHVSFSNNINIDAIYRTDYHGDSPKYKATLEELKQELKSPELKPPIGYVTCYSIPPLRSSHWTVG